VQEKVQETQNQVRKVTSKRKKAKIGNLFAIFQTAAAQNSLIE
jgi:hypothetical protein